MMVEFVLFYYSDCGGKNGSDGLAGEMYYRERGALELF